MLKNVIIEAAEILEGRVVISYDAGFNSEIKGLSGRGWFNSVMVNRVVNISLEHGSFKVRCVYTNELFAELS